MLYGLSGAHRAGKSTLAASVAKGLGIKYEPIRTTEVAKRAGFNPVGAMTLTQRLDLQRFLFDDMVKQARAVKEPTIFDRTFLDHAVYLLCEFHMTSHEDTFPRVLEQVNSFVDQCVEATVNHMDFIYYVDRLSVYVEEPGKPAPNPAYQRHYALTMLGLLTENNKRLNWGHVPAMAIEERTRQLGAVIAGRMQAVNNMRASARYIH